MHASQETIEEKLVLTLVDEETEVSTSFQITDGSREHDDIKLCNDENESDVENLINLPYLHEPAILYCLERRYQGSNIYTYTGPILIAVNPFKSVATLYSSQILETYYNYGLLKSQGIADALTVLPPHIYAIADAAYRDMMRVVMTPSSSKAAAPHPNANQSILISGESGAGKTESTKIVLKYLTIVGNSSSGVEYQTGSIMDKIIQSNPILESFGNARTLRNDNSSRFGKYIDLNFSKRGHLIGGSISSYLLEKVRLVSQNAGERNFHIFYQLIAGASAEDKERWGIATASAYCYINQGGVFQLKAIDDSDEYATLIRAFTVLNFEQKEQASVLNTVAALLHLGQLKFVSDEQVEEGSTLGTEADISASAKKASELLGIDEKLLITTLTVRTITARSDSYLKRLTPLQAAESRDALSKAVYGHLFDWIVRKINTSIAVDASTVRANIGVLDIFGFECFKANSFEQLCINYTNESLQQQFNQFVFKMEQQEYQREKIEWSFIEFPDNQDCLDLIEHKKSGILAMLDDECKLPGASDDKFASRLHKTYEGNPRFSASATQKRNSQFCINHYAGFVVYTVITFVEKNKDELPKEASSLMHGSSNPLIASLFPADDASDQVKKLSVGFQFREQLGLLMGKIHLTSPHYIRCLKPNDQNVSDTFHRIRTTEQLRYGGVLEAVRVARSGFPVRLSHADFLNRYQCIFYTENYKKDSLKLYTAGGNKKELCDVLFSGLLCPFDQTKLDASLTERQKQRLQHWVGGETIGSSSIQPGLTKVFLRKTAHDVLEGRRSRRILQAVLLIQSTHRTTIIRSWFLAAIHALQAIQRMTRGMLSRKRVYKLRCESAAVKIQKIFRSHSAYFKFLMMKGAVIILQSRARANMAKRHIAELRYNRHAGKLNRIFRGLIQRKRFLETKKSVVSVQCLFRKRNARKTFLKLKAEARDVGKLKKNNEDLKAEIEMLRARAADDSRKLQEKIQLEFEENAKKLAERENVNMQTELSWLRDALATEKKLRVAAETALEDKVVALSSAEVMIQQLTITRDAVKAPASPVPPPVKISQVPGLQTSQTVYVDYSEDLLANQLALSNERKARKALEDEVSRLRHISMDLTTQLDNVRKHLPASADDIIKRRLAAKEKSGGGGAPGRSNASAKSPSSWLGSAWESATSLKPDGTRESSDHSPLNVNLASEMASSVGESVADGANVVKQLVLAAGKTVSKFSGNPMVAKNRQRNADIALKKSTNTFANSQVAIDKFNRNLDIFKSKLMVGVKCFVWEGEKITKQEMLLKINATSDSLAFDHSSSSRFTFSFTIKKDILPVRISTIVECIPGGEVGENVDEQCLMTIVIKESAFEPRMLALKFATKDEKIMVQTGIRSLISSHTMQSPPSAGESAGAGASSAEKRAMRKLSLRDAVLQETIAGGSASTPASTPEPTDSGVKASTPAEYPDDIVAIKTVPDLKKQLLIERSNYERLMVQMLSVTNDLNDREDVIIRHKSRESELSQALVAKERLYEQDVMVRMQLGKRLEQVLIDKEEAYEQIEMLKDQIEAMRAPPSP